MKSKNIFKAGLGFLVGVILMGMSAVPAYAEETVDNDTVISSEEDYEKYMQSHNDEGKKSDNSSLDVDWDIVVNPNAKGEGILTPEGNLTLVDDIDEEHSESLQYMTVQTKNGNFFYIVVDRSGDEDNVYFLNMVDESDLMALMDEETQEKFNEAMLPTVKEEKNEDDSTLLFSNQDAKENSDTKDIEKEPIKEKGPNPAGMLVVFIIIGAAVAGGYYFFKIKPQREQPDIDEDLEFYDDEDYINEESIIEEVDHDTLVSASEDEYQPQVDDFSDESVDE